MTTHIGKIGRLPKFRRHELGQRIEDNLPGTELVQWLNAQPDVQYILKHYFNGRPITEQNLSEWKQSGHIDWLRRQEARQAALRLIEHSDDLDEAAQGQNLGDRFATVFAAELTRLAMALLEPETDPEKKWQRLCQIHRELSRLRRDDDRAARTALKQQRWEREAERHEEEESRRRKEEHKEHLLDTITEAMNIKSDTELFGGGEVGKKWAQRLYRIKCGLPMDDRKKSPPATTRTNPEPPSASHAVPHTCAKPPTNPQESRLIQPNPTENNDTQPETSVDHNTQRALNP